MKALRVFFALWPDANVRDQLAALARAAAERAHGRAPPPENLHLTLAFVGEVPADAVGRLCATGRAAAATASPFALVLDRIGAFHRQGIVWAGASSPPAALDRLAADVGRGLAVQGFRFERRTFQAHVTLARQCRIRAGDPIRDGESLSASIAWDVERMALMSSEPASGPPRYRELAGWPLTPDAGRA